jgi:hypothetical protein
MQSLSSEDAVITIGKNVREVTVNFIFIEWESRVWYRASTCFCLRLLIMRKMAGIIIRQSSPRATPSPIASPLFVPEQTHAKHQMGNKLDPPKKAANAQALA